jgi:hypothetical protein
MRKVTETRKPVNPTTGEEVREYLDDSDGDSQMEDGDIPYDYYPPQLHAEIPLSPSSPEPERVNRRARVEEVEDEEAGDQSRWIEDYQEPAGSPGNMSRAISKRSEQSRERMAKSHGHRLQTRRSGSSLSG